MKKIILSLILSVFVGSLLAQVTTEDNQKDIKTLERKITSLKSTNARLSRSTKSLAMFVSNQNNKIDSLTELLNASDNKIIDNKKSLTTINQQIKQIFEESGEISSKMNKTTLYFAVSLIILLILIVLVLIILNIKRKKEVNRLSEKITGIDMKLTNKVSEIQKLIEQKLVDAQAKNLKLIAEIKSENEKQKEATKILLNQKYDELKSLLNAVNQKFETDLAEKISTLEGKADKTHKGFTKKLSDTKKIFDESIAGISKDIEQLTKRVNTKK